MTPEKKEPGKPLAFEVSRLNETDILAERISPPSKS
jgi:hypothetical protein